MILIIGSGEEEEDNGSWEFCPSWNLQPRQNAPNWSRFEPSPCTPARPASCWTQDKSLYRSRAQQRPGQMWGSKAYFVVVFQCVGPNFGSFWWPILGFHCQGSFMAPSLSVILSASSRSRWCLSIFCCHWRNKILWLLRFGVIQINLNDEEAWVGSCAPLLW